MGILTDHLKRNTVMNFPINKIATILGILASLAAAGSWVYVYHGSLVTKSEKALTDLDGKISGTVILTTLYELHGLPELSELERVKYDRANTRLVALKEQRDKLLGVSSD
jgi:hypothetical protein